MTSPLFSRLAATLAASSLSEDAAILSRVHGSVKLRAHFYRTEVVRTRQDVETIDAEPYAVVETGRVPELGTDDLIHVDGRLWHIRTPLQTGGGQTKCLLMQPQYEDAEIDGVAVKIAWPGDIDDSVDRAQAILVGSGGGAELGAVLELADGGDWLISRIDSWQPGLRRMTLTPA